jgi:hypothetical protein
MFKTLAKAPSFGEDIFLYFLPFNGNPTHSALSRYYLAFIQNSLAYKWSGQQALACHVRICTFYATIIDRWPILFSLLLVRHHQQTNQFLSLGMYTPQVTRDHKFFKKIGIAYEKFENLLRNLFRPRSLIFFAPNILKSISKTIPIKSRSFEWLTDCYKLLKMPKFYWDISHDGWISMTPM